MSRWAQAANQRPAIHDPDQHLSPSRRQLMTETNNLYAPRAAGCVCCAPVLEVTRRHARKEAPMHGMKWVLAAVAVASATPAGSGTEGIQIDHA